MLRSRGGGIGLFFLVVPVLPALSVPPLEFDLVVVAVQVPQLLLLLLALLKQLPLLLRSVASSSSRSPRCWSEEG